MEGTPWRNGAIAVGLRMSEGYFVSSERDGAVCRTKQVFIFFGSFLCSVFVETVCNGCYTLRWVKRLKCHQPRYGRLSRRMRIISGFLLN